MFSDSDAWELSSDGDTDDNVSTISLNYEEEVEMIRRVDMIHHATFRRNCVHLIDRHLGFSIFKSLGSKTTRETLLGKGKRCEVEWSSPRDWTDINIVMPGSRTEYREFRAAQQDPWVTFDEITFQDGLTSGFWTSCIEWSMRIDWRSLRVVDEGRSTRVDHKRCHGIYSRALQNEDIMDRHSRDNDLHPGEFRQELIVFDDGSEGFESSYDTTSQWELDEDPPWYYMINNREDNMRMYSPLKQVVEQNRDPKVAAMRERLFNVGLPSTKGRLADIKVDYELVDNYQGMSGKKKTRITRSRPTKIRFNPSVYVHGDSIDEDDGEAHPSLPLTSARSAPLCHSNRHTDGENPRSRYAPTPPPYDIYTPNLSYLSSGSFRVMIMSTVRIQALEQVRIIVRARAEANKNPRLRSRPKLTRLSPRGMADERLKVRWYEEACFLHEMVTCQAAADAIIDQKPNWTAERDKSFESALVKMGWTTQAIRSGVKIQPATKRRNTFTRVVRKVFDRFTTTFGPRLESTPRTPDLDSGSETSSEAGLVTPDNFQYNSGRCPKGLDVGPGLAVYPARSHPVSLRPAYTPPVGIISKSPSQGTQPTWPEMLHESI